MRERRDTPEVDPSETLGVTSTLLWSQVGAIGFSNGGTIVFCPPPCAGAVPFGEIAHVGSLAFGGLATYVTVRAIRATTQRVSWWRAAPDLVLIVVTFSLLNLLFDG